MSALATQDETIDPSTEIIRASQNESCIYKTRLRGDCIRLIQLLPGSGDAPLQCYLTEASIEGLPPYEALSYVWGDANVTEPISCNGETLRVTTNLAKALRKIRTGISTAQAKHEKAIPGIISIPRRTELKPTPPLLWVDAISINQADIVERNHQVALMGVIYSRAQRVILWLGDIDITAEESVALLVAVEVFELILLTQTCYERPVASQLQLKNENFLQYMSERGYADKEEVWRAVSLLFASAWFTRIWCVQEAISARETTVLFAFGEFRTTMIQTLAAWLIIQCFENQWSPPQLRDLLPNITESRNRLAHRDHGSSDIMTYVNIYSRLSATDPRDKIYGLLGLARDTKVDINYGKSTLEVYSAFVLNMLDRGLQIFSHIYHPIDLGDHNDFPSWVPRWDQTCSKCRLYDFPRDNVLSRRKASSPLDLDLAASGILRMSGLLCDTVVAADHIRFDPEHLIYGKIVETGQHFVLYLQNLWYKTQTLDTAGNFTDYRLAYSLALNLTGGHIGLHEMVDDLGLAEQIHFLRCFLATMKPLIPDGLDWIDLEGADTDVFQGLLTLYCHDRKLFRTSKGWLGLGPRCMRPDDFLVVLDGGPVPYILRPKDDGRFQFLGECYVSAIARGEVYDMIGQDGVEERVFDLV